MEGEVLGVAVEANVAVGIEPHADGEVGGEQDDRHGAEQPEGAVKAAQGSEPGEVAFAGDPGDGVEAEDEAEAQKDGRVSETEYAGDQEDDPGSAEATQGDGGGEADEEVAATETEQVVEDEAEPKDGDDEQDGDHRARR